VKIPITPTVEGLYPTVLLFGSDAIVEANFGDNPAHLYTTLKIVWGWNWHAFENK
jgi:hypothetical protein